MEFTTSNGFFVSENIARNSVLTTIKDLNEWGYAIVFSWEKELIKWSLNKYNIKCKNDDFEEAIIDLYQDITENELKQLEQLLDFWKL